MRLGGQLEFMQLEMGMVAGADCLCCESKNRHNRNVRAAMQLTWWRKDTVCGEFLLQ